MTHLQNLLSLKKNAVTASAIEDQILYLPKLFTVLFYNIVISIL